MSARRNPTSSMWSLMAGPQHAPALSFPHTPADRRRRHRGPAPFRRSRRSICFGHRRGKPVQRKQERQRVAVDNIGRRDHEIVPGESAGVDVRRHHGGRGGRRHFGCRCLGGGERWRRGGGDHRRCPRSGAVPAASDQHHREQRGDTSALGFHRRLLLPRTLRRCADPLAHREVPIDATLGRGRK